MHTSAEPAISQVAEGDDRCQSGHVWNRNTNSVSLKNSASTAPAAKNGPNGT